MKYCYTYNLDDTICLATQAEHDEYPLDHTFQMDVCTVDEDR